MPYTQPRRLPEMVRRQAGGRLWWKGGNVPEARDPAKLLRSHASTPEHLSGCPGFSTSSLQPATETSREPQATGMASSHVLSFTRMLPAQGVFPFMDFKTPDKFWWKSCWRLHAIKTSPTWYPDPGQQLRAWWRPQEDAGQNRGASPGGEWSQPSRRLWPTTHKALGVRALRPLLGLWKPLSLGQSVWSECRHCQGDTDLVSGGTAFPWRICSQITESEDRLLKITH